MKLKITSLMVLLSYSNAVCGATTSQLSNAMVKYCVPTSAGTCTDRATYRSITNTCVCGLGKYYSGRKCNKCAPGTYADKDDLTSCKTCPAGTCATIEGSQSCKSCGFAAATCDAKNCQIKTCQSGFVLRDGKCKLYREYRSPGNYTIHLPAGTYKVTVAGAGGGKGGNTGSCSQYQYMSMCIIKCWLAFVKCKTPGPVSGGVGGRGEGLTRTITLNEGNYNITVGRVGNNGANGANAPYPEAGWGLGGSTICTSDRKAGLNGNNGSVGGSSKFYNITARGGGGGTGATTYKANGWFTNCDNFNKTLKTRTGSTGTSYSGGAPGGSHGWVIIESV